MREGVDLKRKNKMHQTNLLSDGGVVHNSKLFPKLASKQ